MKTKKVNHKKNLPLFKSSRLKIIKKSILFFLLLSSIAISAQTIIVNSGNNYGCGASIALVADTTSDILNSTFSWDVTGSLLLKKTGTSNNGVRSIKINGDNNVNLTVRGKGKVFLKITDNSTIPAKITRYDVDIEPTSNIIAPTFSLKYGNINVPDYIKTRSHWIPLDIQTNNNQTVTVTNDQQFTVAWFASSGVSIVNQVSTAVFNSTTNKYESSATITSDGTINKGFLTASFIDTCTGVCGGGPSTRWEILKNFNPTQILGVTCLRDNNLDISKSTVYSVPDEVASNGIFDWELLDSSGNVFDATKLKIQSSELYGNAAAIIYKDGFVPSNVGNFIIRITNTVYGNYSFDREITASPASPKTQQIYCAPATLNSKITVEVDNPEADKEYSWSIVGTKDWTITPISTSKDKIEITFNDTESGSLIVTSANTSDSNCDSSGTAVFINRVGGNASIEGLTCVQSTSTDSFTLTATPFAKYDWSVPSDLTNDGWEFKDNGNTITLTPPSSGINVTGNFSITASLDGCSSISTATHNFEIAPLQPVITGTTCVESGNNYTYGIDYRGANNAEVTVIDSNGTIVESKHLTSPDSFSFKAINNDFSIKAVTYNNTSCESLATTLNVRVAPSATKISQQVFACNNEIEFTASANGTVSNYQWSFPIEWIVVGGSQGSNSIIFQTFNTGGEVTVTPSNNGCTGSVAITNVAPPNSVNITSSEFSPGSGFYLIRVSSDIDLVMKAYVSDALTRPSDILCDDGTPVSTNSDNETQQIFFFARKDQWVSINLKNMNTDCDKCHIFKVGDTGTTDVDIVSPKVAPGSNLVKATIKKQLTKPTLKFKAYPNPVNNLLNIEIPSKEKLTVMALVDLKGQILFTKETTNNKESIDTSAYSKGTYVLYVQTENGYTSKKIIIE